MRQSSVKIGSGARRLLLLGATSVIAASSVAIPAVADEKESAPAQPVSSRGSQMALQVGQYFDQAWDVVPNTDVTTVRLLFKLDGRPFAGKLSMRSEFTFRAIDKDNERFYNVGLNPNLNGRWFHETVAPGRYNVQVIGQGRFAGWEWAREDVVFEPNTAPLIELDLVPADRASSSTPQDE